MNIIEVIECKDENIIVHIKELFNEYANSLGFDLSFQNFQRELDNLPGDYSPPRGCLLSATYKDKIIGCVALRPLNNKICEMKRLYVKPEFRGLGIGKKLVQRIIEKAKELNYNYMRLDTIEFMEEAIKLYKSLGFYEIEAYTFNPVKGVKFMELKLVEG